MQVYWRFYQRAGLNASQVVGVPMDSTGSLKVSPGQGILNVGELNSFTNLQSRFDAVDFLDLCSVLEALVLFDQVVVFGRNAEPGNQAFWAPLVKGSVLTVVELCPEDGFAFAQETVKHESAVELLNVGKRFHQKVPGNLVGSTAVMAWCASMVLDVVASHELDIPLILSAHFAPIYDEMETVRVSQTVSRVLHDQMRQAYNELTDNLAGMRVETGSVDILNIPPIALDILRRCHSVDDIAHCTLDVRYDFANFRNRIVAMDEIMEDKGVSPRRKLKERAKILYDMSLMCDLAERKNMIESAVWPAHDSLKKIREAASLNNVVKKSFVAGINIDKLFDLIMGGVPEAGRFFRLAPLRSVRRNYLETSDRQMVEIVKRLFGHSINKGDFDRVEAYYASFKVLSDLRL